VWSGLLDQQVGLNPGWRRGDWDEIPAWPKDGTLITDDVLKKFEASLLFSLFFKIRTLSFA
jgi:hypothetical protein